jgi:hypothetical protein
VAGNLGAPAATHSRIAATSSGFGRGRFPGGIEPSSRNWTTCEPAGLPGATNGTGFVFATR